MASGQQHDYSTKLWAVPFGLILTVFIGPLPALLGGCSFLVGGLWLSPDLDTTSNSLKRWGLIKIIWWPYRKLIPHRSILSHGPLIGTSIRIIYLACIFSLIWSLLQPLEIESPINIMQRICRQITKYPDYSLPIIIGLEGSAWLHLLKDGDPLPREIKSILNLKKSIF